MPKAAAIVCVLQFIAIEASAHVGDADHGAAAPARETGKSAVDKLAIDKLAIDKLVIDKFGIDLAVEKAKHGRACAPSSGAKSPFAGFALAASAAASAPAAAPLQLSEVRLDGVRAAGPVYRDLLSLFEGLDPASDIVHVAEGTSPDGASCPLYVSIGDGASRQTFWRFAPDDEPESWFDDEGRRLGDAAFTSPIPGSRLSSPFGPRRYYGRASGGGFHDGIDFESKVGEPIFAAADGVIEHQGGYFEYGLTTKIRHAAQQVTLYAHMSRFAKGVAVGTRVRKGELIGYIGMTGRSTGPHLHFSTIINGKFVDPAPYLSNNGKRYLSSPSLVTFRKWQLEILDTVKSARDQQRRPHFDDFEWTKRI